MGFDVNRFESCVSDEFICTICTDVLDDPLVTPICEHIFCGECIKYWLTSGPTNAEPCCPIDRTPATVDSLKAPLRSFRNLLYGQNIRCSFSPACNVYVKLQNLVDHENACNYNPVNIEKEVECENKCGAKYKMQNKDKHNCILYLQKEMKLMEDRASKDVERLRQLEKENGKLAKKLEESKRKWEESKLNVRNELQLKEEVNVYLTRQLEEAHEEIVRLKGQAAETQSRGLRSRTASANGSSATVSNGTMTTSRPRSIAIPSNHLTVTGNSLSVDTALLVDLQEFSTSNSREVSSSSNGDLTSNSRLSNSKFYSTSSSSVSTTSGTVRSTGSGHSSSESNHSNRSSAEVATTNVVNIHTIFNNCQQQLQKLFQPSLPKMAVSSPSQLPSPSPASTSASTSTAASTSTSPSSPPPVPPPKPPKPTIVTNSTSTSNHQNNNHHHYHHHQHNNNQNNNHQQTNHSNYANFDIISTYPSTSHNLTVLPVGNGFTSSTNNIPSLLPPPSTSIEQLIIENCKKQRILQVLKMVNRRHFFPANEYYKAAATKKGAHAFTLSYEIRLLEILESYINSESRVLDIGSGMGFITVCLAHLAKTVIGVEHVKGLVNKANEIVNSHYGNLITESQGPHRIIFLNEDGRYGLERLGRYDLILVEPIVRNNVPDIFFNQLKPGGCVVAVIRTESRLAMYRITRNEQKKHVRQTLIDDGQYLAGQLKDYLCDIKQQEMPFLNKIKSLQL